jgi:DNA polymerase
MRSLQEKLEEIAKEIRNCRKCPLFKGRKNPVPGEGNPQAKIFFIGEAPGAQEDKTGRPFAGKAGKILDEMLKEINLKREEVFIGNVVKCRPPHNRDPKVEEIKACAPYLERQLEIIKPEIICTLGNYSANFIFEKYGLKKELQGVSKIHGKIFKVKIFFQEIIIIPFYHPAAAIYLPNLKKVLLEDVKILKKLL